MLNTKKNKSIVQMLRDRELNIKYTPYCLGLKIVNQLISSNNRSLYSNTWERSSTEEISYDSGNIYFLNYKQYCSVNVSDKKLPPLYKMEQTSSRKRVSDVISYSGMSVCKNIESICDCQNERCICLSHYLLSISEDNWLCQHYMANGKLMKQIYVNLFGENIKFKYLDWDMYGERFILTTTHKPFNFASCPSVLSREKFDIAAYLAVFTTFPIEFFALMEIKRSVFGYNLSAVSISNQSLIIGLDSRYVAIYNFDDFLKEGTLIPYKLGDRYKNKGKIGSYPTGLPLNFTYNAAPPALVIVQCLQEMFRFGGCPYHCITVDDPLAIQPGEFRIIPVATETPIKPNKRIKPDIILDFVNILDFHPDQSNRIILKRDDSIDIYKIITEKGIATFSELYSMELSSNTSDSMIISSYGMTGLGGSRRSVILSFDYENQLEIFAVLAKYIEDDSAFILLYDSKTGEELRRIRLKREICNSKKYYIYMDLYAIIIIERDGLLNFTVHVYNM